jgi:hypothetical protein
LVDGRREEFPPPLTPAEATELRRRQRGRNLALLVALVAVAALFYAIAIVKLGDTPHHLTTLPASSSQ